MSSSTPPPSYPPGDSGPAGPSAGGYPSYPGGPAQPAGGEGKGFLGSLFDFSFNSFVTPKLVRFVYLLATIVIGLVLLFYILFAFRVSPAFGIFVLIGGPLVALLYLALIRMMLELYYSVIRMSEDIHHRLPGR